MNYTVNIETITPLRASALLAQFPRNRSSSVKRVASYAESMAKGSWAPFSMVIIDENGNTVDGHHRLEAVVKSGKSVDMVVFRGLDRKYIPFIDTGRPRSAGDMLAFIDEIDGLTSFRNVAALARAVIYYYNGDHSCVVPPDELANFIVSNKDDIKHAISEHKRLRDLKATLSAEAALFVIRRENPDMKAEVDAFVNRIVYGENLKIGMPTMTARNVFLSERGRSSGAAVWCKSFYTILRAWNAELNGENLYKVQLTAATLENIKKIKIKKED